MLQRDYNHNLIDKTYSSYTGIRNDYLHDRENLNHNYYDSSVNKSHSGYDQKEKL